MSPDLDYFDYVDFGPEEPNLYSEYIDASLLEEHCQACRLRRKERRQRIHKAQTFRRA